jgi:hypothetical protein
VTGPGWDDELAGVRSSDVAEPVRARISLPLTVHSGLKERVARRRRVTFGITAIIVVALSGVALIVLRSTGSVALPLPPGVQPRTGPDVAGDSGRGDVTLGPAVSGGTIGTAGGTSPGVSGQASGAPVMPGATGSAAPVASVSPVASLTPEPTAVALRAAYVAKGPSGLLGLSGYKAQVTITNPGSADVSGWQVIISLPDGTTASNSVGASVNQSGARVTFTPVDDTRTVPAGGQVVFTFEVGGLLAGQPTGCAIDGRPCG